MDRDSQKNALYAITIETKHSGDTDIAMPPGVVGAIPEQLLGRDAIHDRAARYLPRQQSWFAATINMLNMVFWFVGKERLKWDGWPHRETSSMETANPVRKGGLPH